MSVVLYGINIGLSLMGEHRQRVFEKRMMRKIFRRSEEVT
jgi:hypothetical protein